MKDWRGTPIEVGSVIVYPGRHGSSHWVTEAEVVEIRNRLTWSGEFVPLLKVARRRDNNWRGQEGTSYIERINMVTVVG